MKAAVFTPASRPALLSADTRIRTLEHMSEGRATVILLGVSGRTLRQGVSL
jgi:hypothetical protein